MNNSIRRQGQRGGMAIIAIIVLTIGLAALSINEIRMGGPIHRDKVVISDFSFDIAPTPLYMVEPFLEVALMRGDPQNFSKHRNRLAELERTYRERLAFWSKSELDPALRTELVEAESKDSDRFWKEVNENMIPAMQSQNPEQINAAFANVNAAFNTHASSIRKLVADAKAAEHARSETADTTLLWSGWLLVALSLGILGTIMFSLRYLTRRALDPLVQTADTMSRMAAGDLEVGRTIHHSDDEIGEMTQAIEVFRATSQQQIASEATQRAVVLALSAALKELAEGNLTYTITTPLAEEYEGLRATFNQTVTDLAALMASVNASAASVNTGAAEIRAASDDLALRNEQQAASLEETAAAMNQVTGTVSETARGAVEVRKAIETAHGEATEGGAVVQRAMTAMSAIEQSSQEIGQIVNVIDSIAFQTNLLALNAGVEAARAGDAGKGFAVVANEVRALAQRSADAAKDIKGLITNSSGQVSQGVTLVGETGTLLEKIVSRVGEVNELISEIARSTESQASSLQQVNIAVGEMDRMTQQNASMVEESTAAARSLADEASEVTRLVSHFRTGMAEKAIQRGRSAPLAAPASRRKPAPVHAPAHTHTHAQTMPMPTHGNLALKPIVDEDDWTEF